jgi:hypothetical protein
MMQSEKHPIEWFTLGSIVGLWKYYSNKGFHFEIMQVVPKVQKINWFLVYSHVMEAVIVAVFAGAATYLSKEVTRWVVKKIRQKYFKP